MITVGSLQLTKAHRSAVMSALDSGQLSPGPKCALFEKEFSKVHGARHGLFVNSGTDALRIALLALKEKFGWKDGAEVICPALTFVASLNVILQAGLRPRLIDVSPTDFNLDPMLLAKTAELFGRTRAVMPVHLFGKPCDMQNIAKIAGKYDLRIIEDSCETMGVNRLRGDVSCFSTYVCHLMSTGVGGLAITNDRILMGLMRSYANHGRSVDHIPGTTKAKDIKKRFQFDRIGYSSRATELQAALGLVELEKLPDYIARRREIVWRLILGLDLFPQIQTPLISFNHAFMMFPIVLRSGARFSKWKLCKFLEKAGIETREMLPLINQPCYQFLGIDRKQFPVADWVNKNGFYVGCHPGLSDQDVQHIIRTFRRFFDEIR